jgi:hypothetical protein
VSYPIIRISIKSNSKEIKGLKVVFIPLQLILSRVVECVGDHVRLLNNLSNGTALAQKIVASSVLPITEILAIKNDKLHNIFLHVVFGSQSMLKSSSD